MCYTDSDTKRFLSNYWDRGCYATIAAEVFFDAAAKAKQIDNTVRNNLQNLHISRYFILVVIILRKI